MEHPLILALETSCDESAVAILRGPDEILAAEISTQIPLHQPYGGVVPELASRNHLLLLHPLIKETLQRASLSPSELDAIAATIGPGLASSLLIGASLGKALATSLQIPFLGINHLEGHLLSPFFGSRPNTIPPAICLLVSGGHTLLAHFHDLENREILGTTRDDAAGEAFDKVAQMVGLEYPGGPAIEKRAQGGNPHTYELPRSMCDRPGYEFSFSGLKTAVRYLLPQLKGNYLPDLCASFQETVVDILVHKTLRAAEEKNCSHIALSGGVACNRRLREAFSTECDSRGWQLSLPEPRLTTDNALMIAYAAYHHLQRGLQSDLNTPIDPNLALK